MSGYESEGRFCCVQTLHDVHSHLRGRADSYWSDSIILKDNGDESMCLVYRTIADELRQVASSLGDDLGDGGVAQ